MKKRDPVLEAYLSGDEEAFVRELSIWNIQNAFRPRDEWDVDVYPESLRGAILELYDAYNALPWYFRVWARVYAWFRR